MGYDQASLGDNLFVWRAFEYVYNILHYSPFTAAAILSDAVFLRRGSLLRNCPQFIVWWGVGEAGAVEKGGVLSKGRVCRSAGVLLATGLWLPAELPVQMLTERLRALLPRRLVGLISSATLRAS